MNQASLSEEVLLATLICEPTRVTEAAAVVAPSDLAHPKNRALYETLLELVMEGVAIDEAAVLERLYQSGTMETVTEAHIARLVGLYDPDAAMPWHLTELRRQARLRRFESSVRHAVRQLEHGEDPEVVWEMHRSRLEEIGETYANRSEDDLTVIATELMAEIEAKGERGLRWPYPEINQEAGLMRPGKMWLVSGFSGSGKSAFLRSAVLGMTEQPETSYGAPKVAYFAIEETGPDVLGLMACASSGVSYIRYGRGEDLAENEQLLIADGVNRVHQSGRLRINRQKVWSPQQLLAKTRVYCQEHGVNVVVIDHAHLIDYPGRTDGERDFHVGKFAETLHAYADMHNFTAIVAYQPRKPGEGGDIWRPVSPDEIRGTSRIWNIAENSLSPYRPWLRHDAGTLEVLQDQHGVPLTCGPFQKSKPNEERPWVGRPAQEYTFVMPGKARIGGYGSQPLVFRFNQVSGRITPRIVSQTEGVAA